MTLVYWGPSIANNNNPIQVRITSNHACAKRVVPAGWVKELRIQALQNSAVGGSALDTGVNVEAGVPLGIEAQGVWYANENELTANADGVVVDSSDTNKNMITIDVNE